MNKPTCEQLLNEELKSVKITDDTSWRHGFHRTEIFYRKEDETYWRVKYDVSTDGETNGLEDGYAKIFKVKPVKIEVIDYILDE